MHNSEDIAWMQVALGLAQQGLYTTRENPRVGCVLVKDHQQIGAGYHQYPGGAHAEVLALAAARDAKGATAYVTLAPCTHFGKTPPCADALIKAGVARVVAASADPNPLVGEHTAEKLSAAGILYEVDVCKDAALALNPGFFMRMQKHRPFVRLKTAMSLDGRTAMQNGQSQWVTGASARALVQKIRAQSCAIMTSIHTVLMDDPSLTVRDDEILSLYDFEQPIRVILDSQLRMPLTAKLLSLPGAVWIYTCHHDLEKTAALHALGAQVFVMPQSGHHLDLPAVLAHMARQKINEVLVEAGPILNGALLQAQLVDEWHLFVAPKIMGDAARGLCTLPGLNNLSQALNLDIKQRSLVGEDDYYIASIRS